MELRCGNMMNGRGCGRNVKALLAMLYFAASMVASAFPNYWTIQGLEEKPAFCGFNAGDGDKAYVYVGVTGQFNKDSFFGTSPVHSVLYYGASPKRLFLNCSTDVTNGLVDNFLATDGRHSYIEVSEKDIPVFHQACVKAAQFEKKWIEDEDFRLKHGDTFVPAADIGGIYFTRIEVEFPKTKLWTCYDSYYGKYKCINEFQPLALISFVVAEEEGVYELLAAATPRKKGRLPKDWWRHWKGGKEVRLDIFDFNSFYGDSFAKLAEMTDPAYLDYVWRLSQKEKEEAKPPVTAQASPQENAVAHPMESRQSETSPKCSSCAAIIPPNAKFCPECGAKIPKSNICPKCTKESPQEANFCAECGTRLPGK